MSYESQREDVIRTEAADFEPRNSEDNAAAQVPAFSSSSRVCSMEVLLSFAGFLESSTTDMDGDSDGTDTLDNCEFPLLLSSGRSSRNTLLTVLPLNARPLPVPEVKTCRRSKVSWDSLEGW